MGVCFESGIQIKVSAWLKGISLSQHNFPWRLLWQIKTGWVGGPILLFHFQLFIFILNLKTLSSLLRKPKKNFANILRRVFGRRRDKYSNEVEEKARSADYVEPIKKPLSIPFVASSKGTPNPDPHSMPPTPEAHQWKVLFVWRGSERNQCVEGRPSGPRKIDLTKRLSCKAVVFLPKRFLLSPYLIRLKPPYISSTGATQYRTMLLLSSLFIPVNLVQTEKSQNFGKINAESTWFTSSA